MAKASNEPQGGLWDDDIVPTYIDAEAAREQRAASFARFQDDLFAGTPMVSGHNIFLEVVNATINGHEIQLSYKVHGIVQRPCVIAVPATRELHHANIEARLANVEDPAPVTTGQPETTADRIQARSDLL